MLQLNFLKNVYHIEIREADTSELSLDIAEKLEEEVANKERLMREQLSFLESMGDIILSYECNTILVEIVGEYADKTSNKVNHVATSYENSIVKLLEAYKCLMELEEMLA